jgi:hypothetical protein
VDPVRAAATGRSREIFPMAGRREEADDDGETANPVRREAKKGE